MKGKLLGRQLFSFQKKVTWKIPGFVAERDPVSERASIGDPGGGVEVPSSLRGSVEIRSSDGYFYNCYVEVVQKNLSRH
jgi:hypothetical protein